MVTNLTFRTGDETPEWEALRTALYQLIRQYEAFDPERRWVNLDHLWHASGAFKSYTRLLIKYVRLVMGDSLSPDVVILAADTSRSSFGILPAAAVAAYELGCDFTIWKELGDLTWGIPRFFPEPEPGKTCIILQDIVRWGTTVLKVAADLEDYDWSLLAYMAVVQVSEGEERLQATLQELIDTGRTTADFRPSVLLTTDELAERL